MTFQSTPELDIDVRRIYDRLEAAEPGDVVTYQELTQLVGRDVQDGARPCLKRARDRQLKERSRLWSTIRMQGLKLSVDTEIAVGVPEETRAKVGRVVKRGARKLAAIQDLDGLSRDQKTSVLAAQSWMGTVAAFARPSTIKKIEKVIESAGEQSALPLAKTLEAFK